MHCCLLDPECLSDWWNNGIPLRLHWGTTRRPRSIPLLPAPWWRNPSRDPGERVEVVFDPHAWAVSLGTEEDPVRTFTCPGGKTRTGRIRGVTCRGCGEVSPRQERRT